MAVPFELQEYVKLETFQFILINMFPFCHTEEKFMLSHFVPFSHFLCSFEAANLNLSRNGRHHKESVSWANKLGAVLFDQNFSVRQSKCEDYTYNFVI